MKKNNDVIAIIAVILAIVLVVLWYFLGFSHVDAPLDPILGVVVCALVIVFAVVVKKMEDRRRKLLRAVYVEGIEGFNTATGPLDAKGVEDLVDNTYDRLEELEYTYSPIKAPEEFEPKFVVETDKFDVEKEDDSSTTEQTAPVVKTREERLRTWKGCVHDIETDDKVDFDGIDSLRSALSRYYA